ncbi:hypothetical protein Pyn_19511 [Prunus yedoensis var. nudiflora]|uniref:Uncharacterized protein n=1 Tax=Prunus yedoensis var. nudiflora TaxID=2094558 RepID=A0A314XQM7_PRUYE|nr:hypothetical protein Pyn_00266 [Prunus yedoensis var. nudiflora]PQQ12454.1 hypothetical protein Pyn_19511 [Prunus yedoensis var. nudiflora]
MALNLTQDEEDKYVGGNKEPKELTPSLEIIAHENKTKREEEPWFKPKPGSVIPAKRRLVKSMMLDQILHVCPSMASESGVSETQDKPKTSNTKKSNHVYPK